MTYFAQQSLNGVILGAALALFAMGFGLVIANMKVFNVAHEAVFAWGAIITYLLVVEHGVPLIAAWLIAMVLSALLNVLVYALLVRHLFGRRDQELAAFVSTMGGLAVLREIGEMVLDHKTVRLPEGTFPRASWELAGLRFSSNQVLMACVAIAAFAALWWVVDRTRFGREMRAVAFDRETSRLLGINSEKVTIIVFAVSGVMAALAAVPVAVSFNVIEPGLGETYMLIALAIMVAGGFGSVVGTFVAGLSTGLVMSLTSAFLTNTYRDVVVFVILLLLLVLRPQGLFATSEGAARA